MTARRRWVRRDQPVLLLMLLLSVAMHGGAFWLMRVVDANSRTGWGLRPRVHLLRAGLPGREPRADLQLLAERMDPSLLSLPSLHGFSSKLWAHARPAPVAAVDWQVAPSFLEEPPAPPAPVLMEAASLDEALQVETDKPVLPGPVDLAAAAAPHETAASQTVLKLAGAVAALPLMRRPELPSPPSQLGGLKPTSLRIGVDANGLVRQAFLEPRGGSGSEELDQQALALVREVRFGARLRERPSTALVWGRARFYWATAAPAPEVTP